MVGSTILRPSENSVAWNLSIGPAKKIDFRWRTPAGTGNSRAITVDQLMWLHVGEDGARLLVKLVDEGSKTDELELRLSAHEQLTPVNLPGEMLAQPSTDRSAGISSFVIRLDPQQTVQDQGAT